MRFKAVVILYVLVLALFSCEDLLEEVDISNRTITVFAPLDGTTVATNTVQFNWDLVEDATSYRMQLAAPDFENTTQIILDTTIVQDSLGNTPTRIQQSLLNGNYTWRIKALNSGFETPYSINTFTVNGDEDADITAPNIPQLVAPLDGAAQDDTTVSFSWTRTDVPGTAESDSIYFYSDDTLQSLVSKDIGANKSYSATFSSGTFYWVVQAFDTAGNASEDSQVFSFTIN